MATLSDFAPSTVFLLFSLLILQVLRNFNSWWFERPLRHSQAAPLPPGDLGWPVIGNMLSFLRAFKSENPQSFIGAYISRYGRRDVYKAHMFGQTTVLAITAKACNLVLMNDDLFVSGWPKAALTLMGRKAFTSLGPQEHHRLRKLTAAALNGQHVYTQLLRKIELATIEALPKWAQKEHIPLLLELKKFTFQIIADIFISYEPGPKCDAVEREYRLLNHGIRAMAIDLPGSAYNRALKSRVRLVKLLQDAVDERRASQGEKEDVLNTLLRAKDEGGNHLTDEEIIDVLIMYLNAGHESSAHTMMWILILLKRHPEILEKVQREQAEIRKSKRSNELLTFEDYRKMEYLSQVIDETLRLVNISPMIFRKAVKNVEIKGYTIPKGWTVATWMRQVHLDPEVYAEPMKFDPGRWNDLVPKPGEFIPFGAGSHMCPGNNFAKLEMAVFLHHMILNYRYEPVWPECPITHLPHPRPKDNYLARLYKI